VRLLILSASSQSDFAGAFGTLAQQRAGGLLVMGDPFFNAQRDQLIALAARYAVPAIYQVREEVVAGGLMSYGTSFADANRLGGIYVGRVLNGERPADLPVQRPTKLQLVINLKTAKALGLTVPLSVLALADEVIERRREFIAGLGGATAGPVAVTAQQVTRQIAIRSTSCACASGPF
jgi:putative tryptophan/tyrosine transport system substrate-binding protein